MDPSPCKAAMRERTFGDILACGLSWNSAAILERYSLCSLADFKKSKMSKARTADIGRNKL